MPPTTITQYRNGTLINTVSATIDSPGRAWDYLWSQSPGSILKGDVIQLNGDPNQTYIYTLFPPFKFRQVPGIATSGWPR